MKKLIILFYITFTTLVFAEHSEHAHLVEQGQNIIQPELKAGFFDPNGELINLTVNGLVCDFCAQAIEKVFMRRDEVSGINVNLNKGEIIISSKADQYLRDEMIQTLILDAGYNLVEITRQKQGN